MGQEIISKKYPQYRVGSTIGTLTIISFWRSYKYGKAKVMIDCLCECGKAYSTVLTQTAYLHGRGRPVSCGCKPKRIGDGRTKMPEYYNVYMGMIGRCTNPNNPRYKDYGGRGISVCMEWRNDFANFIRDMGRRPSNNHSIDRVDNDGNYCPNNCKWVTSSEQALNRRTSKKYNIY